MAWAARLQASETTGTDLLRSIAAIIARVASVHILKHPDVGDIYTKGSSVAVTMMRLFETTALFVATALAEIIGCYLPYLWLRQGRSVWLLVPAAASLAVFAWLLSLHPTAAGRVYAAYGGVYISVALAWLWIVDGVRPQTADYVGVLLCLVGMAVIMFAPR